MREADFARPRLRAAADERGVRDRVVRRAERPIDQQSGAGRQQAGDRMHGGHLERLVERRAAAGCPATRRAIIVLPAPGGPTSSRLCPPAAAISSARRASSCPRTSARSGGRRGRQGRRAGGAGAAPTARRIVQRADRFGERRDRRARRARRRSPLRWRSPPAAECRRARRAAPPRQSAARRAWRESIRRATARRAARGRRCAAARRRPEAARMPSAIGRSNEAPALRTSAGARLTVIRCGGKLEAGVADRGCDTVAALADAGVRQADHRERRQAERHVDFDVDRAGLDAEDRGRPQAGEHASARLQARAPLDAASYFQRLRGIIGRAAWQKLPCHATAAPCAGTDPTDRRRRYSHVRCDVCAQRLIFSATLRSETDHAGRLQEPDRRQGQAGPEADRRARAADRHRARRAQRHQRDADRADHAQREAGAARQDARAGDREGDGRHRPARRDRQAARRRSTIAPRSSRRSTSASRR